MKLLKIIFAFAIPVFLSACVSVPPLQPPVKFSKATTYDFYRSPLLDQTNHMQQHINQNKDVVYFQNFGGGGAGVGILLGPLGVAANIKMIESNTMKDVAILKDKISVSPQNTFARAATKLGIARQANAKDAIKLNPYILVEKTENDVLMLASAVFVDNPTSKTNPQIKYLVQLPVTYSIKELSSLDATKSKQLEEAIENGFSSLLTRMITDSSSNPEAEQKITILSDFLVPRFKLELAGSLIEKSDSYTWVRTSAGVFGVKSSDVVIKTTGAKK